jgi:hypothetical protein
MHVCINPSHTMYLFVPLIFWSNLSTFRDGLSKALQDEDNIKKWTVYIFRLYLGKYFKISLKRSVSTVKSRHFWKTRHEHWKILQLYYKNSNVNTMTLVMLFEESIASCLNHLITYLHTDACSCYVLTCS